MINGTFEHIGLGFLTVIFDLLLFGQVQTAIAVMITVELTQAEILGWRWKDTIHDLMMDAIGGVMAGIFFKWLGI